MTIPLTPQNGRSSKVAMSDYYHPTQCWWCEGCGDYGVWTAVKQALVELQIPPHQAVLCYDVGCNGNMSDKLKGYRAHTLHGRVISFAAGAKLANPRLPVIAHGGDGACFSEGVGHFVHAVRSNYQIVFILHNNANYGLTTGQASAVTRQGQPMNSSPNGIPENTLNSMDFVFSLEPTFVARGFSGDIKQMTALIKAGIKHRGFAFIDILQACPTYNQFATHNWLMENVKPVGEDYNPADFIKARKTAVDTSNGIATGVLYQNEDVPSFYERLLPRRNLKTVPVEEVEKQDVAKLMEDLL